jgi:glucosamine--fructose-6-phosphate aminotransferase (isomerizing)
MCGIIGYYGNEDAIPILINGLKRLEYRGYDSAGIAVINGGGLNVLKQAGKVKELESSVEESTLKGSVGIAHTRWATHGEPNDLNAHPHMDETGTIVLIHNGIIENYSNLREALQKEGVTFKSDTDTEVLVQWIASFYRRDKLSFEQAVRAALQEVVGTFGIVALCKEEPDVMVAARHGSPLVLGLSDGAYFLASDASPIIEHTRNVIYLDEGEMVILNSDGYTIKQIYKNKVLSKAVTTLNMSLEEIEKGNFPHFMLKEIFDQKQIIMDTMRGRLILDEGSAHLGGLMDCLDRIENASRFYITACGTSWHAGLVGKYLIEECAHIPVHVEYASEFRYRKVIIDSDTVVIAISQSGETADTLAAIRKAKEMGALTVGICNVVGSSIARETDCGVYTRAGSEIGVASTKAFTAQLTVLSMFALKLGRRKNLSKREGINIAKSLVGIEKTIESTLDDTSNLEYIAGETVKANNFLYLGRGLNFPVALEGALKLKEISYIHAEGYPAAEMKHGPIALIDEKMPVVFIAPHDLTFGKVISNIQEVKSRRGKIIVVTDKKSKRLDKLTDYQIVVPTTHTRIFPIVASIPLQLLAYYLAVLRGCEVDQPRNLAKSVTVE